jgi:Bacterial toxin 35
LFKATRQSNKIKLGEQGSVASGLKKTVENKIAKQNDLSAIPVPGKGVIRQGNLRAKIQKYREHIFSEDHKNRGIMAVGENQETIMDLLSTTLLSLDKKGFIHEGNNQLRVSINGIDNVEIRCFIVNGEVRSVNAFISKFRRTFNNFVDTTKAS